jgi:hypothetical protein
MSPPASSPLQAETFGFLLAIKLANILQLQEPRFYTDNSVLASAAAATNIVPTPGHWMIRPLIVDIQSSDSFQAVADLQTNSWASQLQQIIFFLQNLNPY